ncbi:hypothetical protein HPB49_003828 [Dermacentor silvarum]|uniref:Uncharacterized protein n=1 Tax=Dermacentor silvarum TaxID=543639 RepID=A0ACB8DUB8_DERSI|nr:hypothetical protein HPB49_003828 [Dermacentor silvarum]
MNFRTGFGFNPNIFSALAEKTKHMDSFSCHGGIVFDEMKLSEHLDVKSNGELEGFVDLAQFTSESQKEQLSDHGMVVLFQPFQGKWTQVLGVFASQSNVKSDTLGKIIVEATILCEKAGLLVDYVTCDGASWNRSMWKLFGIRDIVNGSENTVATGNGLSPRFQASFSFGSAEERYRLLAGRVAAIAAGYEALFPNIRAQLRTSCSTHIRRRFRPIQTADHSASLQSQSKGIIIEMVPHIALHHAAKLPITQAAHGMDTAISPAVIASDYSRSTLQRLLLSCHPDARVARRSPPTRLPDRGLTRRERSLLLRLRIGCCWTATRSFHLGRTDSPACTQCGAD